MVVQEAVTGKMVLTTTQHQILSSTRWLDDSLMNMGQSMLLQQHPHINGLQNVLLGQKFAFTPQAEEFVQILHENENHWITVSTIGCPPSTINVYDSLHGTVSMHTQRVVADILQSQKAAISFQLQDVQWQANEWDCGLFALANATTLCNGMDPCTVVYLQSAMRQYFLDSIECGFLAPFPLKKKRQRIQKLRVKHIEVYCLCRQPDYGSKLVECSSCKG